MKNQTINIDSEFDGMTFDEKSIQKYTSGQKASATMKGKTLEELVGVEAASKGRAARSRNSTGPRDPAIGQKIAATRRANDSYGKSMLGKEHNASTKSTMAIKARIRQDLKRKLGLGRNDKLPRELLEAEYKRLGIDTK